MADGTALPTWLSFNATTRTFAGTPPLNFNGTLNITVTASDGVLSAGDTFTLSVTPVNDAPIVANLLADRTSAEDTAVSFALTANAFTDVDGDTLVLSAKMADGTALPTWLSFNATTRTFAGTPPLNFNGVLQAAVTASDGQLSARDVFTLTITPVNDAPIVANLLADRTSAEDTAVSFALPANAFTDVDGDTLVLSAKMADGTALPTWLSFNATTRTFAGTPPLNFNGTLNITVTASDGVLSASDTFTLSVTPVNDAPIVANLLSDMTSAEDTAVSFALPANAFTDVDGDTLVLSAKMADGTALPTWLSFNATTRTFAGTPPLNFNGALNITVIASDGSLSTSDTFTLTVTPVNDAPVLTTPLADQTFAQNHAVSIVVPQGAIADLDGDALSYSATLADGASLPTWLSFNTTTLIFSGIPPLNFSGVLQVVMRASDGALVASDQFALTITPSTVDPYAGWQTGTSGADILLGSLFTANRIYGDAGNDVLTGGLRHDQLDGGAGNDILWGLTGNDTLSGNAGNDIIYGGIGNDHISGGVGKDLLVGGTGNDLFVFSTVTDSGTTTATRDNIIDFTQGQDRIDLSQIDTNASVSGDQLFSFVAAQGESFSGGTGQLRWYQENPAGTANDNTIVMGDVNGDGIADFRIELDGLLNLSATDFIL